MATQNSKIVSLSLPPNAPIGPEFGSQLVWQKVKHGDADEHECLIIVDDSELPKVKRIISRWNAIIKDTKPDALREDDQAISFTEWPMAQYSKTGIHLYFCDTLWTDLLKGEEPLLKDARFGFDTIARREIAEHYLDSLLYEAHKVYDPKAKKVGADVVWMRAQDPQTLVTSYKITVHRELEQQILADFANKGIDPTVGQIPGTICVTSAEIDEWLTRNKAAKLRAEGGPTSTVFADGRHMAPIGFKAAAAPNRQ